MAGARTAHLDSVAERSAALALAKYYEVEHHGSMRIHDPAFMLDNAHVWRPMPDFRILRPIGEADPLRLAYPAWVEHKQIGIRPSGRAFRSYASPWLQYADSNVTIVVSAPGRGFWAVFAPDAVRSARRVFSGRHLWLEWPITEFRPVVL